MVNPWHRVTALVSILGALSNIPAAVYSQTPQSSSQPSAAIKSEADQPGQKHYRQGLQDFRQGNYQAAVQAFEQARRLEPQNGAIHSSLGVAYLQLGDRQKAMTALDRAIQLDR